MIDEVAFRLRDARIFLVAPALLAVVAAIGLANLSSKPVTIERLEQTVLNGRELERAYGWPLAWCWRSRRAASLPNAAAFRCDRVRLFVNLAVWSAIVVASSLLCELVVRHFRPRVRCRLRASTLIVLTTVSALTVLANLSFDAAPLQGNWTKYSYGWPLIWHWRLEWNVLLAFLEERDLSAASLGGDLAVWLLMLSATACAWEWLERRYRPRLRFSLRTMLLAVALVGALCECWTVARNRADEQDALVEWLRPHDERGDWSDVDDPICVERLGPKWLDLVGAARYRRRIVGVWLDLEYDKSGSDRSTYFFERLAQLPSLRVLGIHPDGDRRWPRNFTPELATILGGMGQLRMLDLEYQATLPNRQSTRDAARQYLEAIGRLTRLERLRLSIWAESGSDLTVLSNLRRLRTLALHIAPMSCRPDENGRDGAQPGVLDRLPRLPRLEQLDLHDAWITDEDLGKLAQFPRLRALDLCGTAVTGAGLARLAPIDSLQELAIDEQIATAAGFEALLALKGLTKLHIALWQDGSKQRGRFGSLAQDGDQKLTVLRGEPDQLGRALRALRESRPGIVVDAQYDEFAGRVDLRAPWDDGMGAFWRRYSLQD